MPWLRRSSARCRQPTAAVRGVPPHPQAPRRRRLRGACRRSRRARGCHVAGGEVQHALHLERGQLGVLAEHERADGAYVGGREAIAAGGDAPAAGPRDGELPPPRGELDWRGGGGGKKAGGGGG